MNRYDQRGFAYNARPAYPGGLVEKAVRRLGLNSGDRVLEIGAGTGNLTSHFLDLGLNVIAVEPSDMRLQAERRYNNNIKYRSVCGSALKLNVTSELAKGIKAIAVGQAMHWWRDDFERVLKVWNTVTPDSLRLIAILYYLEPSDFVRDLDQLLSERIETYSSQPVKLLLHNSPGFFDEEYKRYFMGAGCECDKSSVIYRLSKSVFWALLNSFSFMPTQNEDPELAEDLQLESEALFDTHANVDGTCIFPVVYKCWTGFLAGSS